MQPSEVSFQNRLDTTQVTFGFAQNLKQNKLAVLRSPFAMGGRFKEPFLRMAMGYAAAATGVLATSSWRRVYAAGNDEGTPATTLVGAGAHPN